MASGRGLGSQANKSRMYTFKFRKFITALSICRKDAKSCGPENQIPAFLKYSFFGNLFIASFNRGTIISVIQDIFVDSFKQWQKKRRKYNLGLNCWESPDKTAQLS